MKSYQTPLIVLMVSKLKDYILGHTILQIKLFPHITSYINFLQQLKQNVICHFNHLKRYFKYISTLRKH